MTTTLHLPRRHRRPLLFPPGLLALAWLLWLGCAALPQMRGMERPQSILQFTAIPNHANNNWAFLPPAYSSEQQLEKFRIWQTISFTGNQWADYFSLNQAEIALERLRVDSTHKSGFRIAFRSSATYGSLVRSIDLLNTHTIEN